MAEERCWGCGVFAQVEAERDRYQEEVEDARAEAVELRAAILEHRRRHPLLTSNADTRLWWKAGL